MVLQESVGAYCPDLHFSWPILSHQDEVPWLEDEPEVLRCQPLPAQVCAHHLAIRALEALGDLREVALPEDELLRNRGIRKGGEFLEGG